MTANPEIPAPSGSGGPSPRETLRSKRTLFDHVESVISRLTAKYPLAHKLASMIWLPYAFRSGIRIKQLDDKSFGAVLPFRRFNRNWYNAMAGAALLGNAEIVGGTYIHGACGGDYTVVCKNLNYRFLRPCYGPAIYRCHPVQDLQVLLASGKEFNLDVDIEVVQSLPTKGIGRVVRVGKCMATFHVTPKVQHKERASRLASKEEAQAGGFDASPHSKAAEGNASEVGGPGTANPSSSG